MGACAVLIESRSEGPMNIRSSGSDTEFGALNSADRRAAIQREELQRLEARKEELASQSAPGNSPEQRIRIWERLHALSLPKSATHKLVRVIASQTELSLQQVLDEQRRRAVSSTVAPSEQSSE